MPDPNDPTAPDAPSELYYPTHPPPRGRGRPPGSIRTRPPCDTDSAAEKASRQSEIREATARIRLAIAVTSVQFPEQAARAEAALYRLANLAEQADAGTL